MAELLSTLEAFRAIVRARVPDRADLLQIESYQWFYDRQRIAVEGDGVFDHLFLRGSTLIAAPADQPAYEALSLLRDGVSTGKIRLHGILKTEPPADISTIHSREGDLDIFEGTLTFVHKDIFNSKGTYTNVHCYADDLQLGDADQAPSVAPTRYPSDAALLEEGRRMMASGMQKRAVARMLAPRAEGVGTFESKVDRLRKAL